MTAFADVVKAFENGRRQYEELMHTEYVPQFEQQEIYGCSEAVNTIADGDNLRYMLHLLKNKNIFSKHPIIYGCSVGTSEKKFCKQT